MSQSLPCQNSLTTDHNKPSPPLHRPGRCNRSLAIGLLLLACLGLSGCGQKGDLYLPSDSDQEQQKQ